MTAKISAYVITFNNERTVEKTLKSLSWADELIVIDSFSSDRTPEIAQKYATDFSQQKFLGHQKQYQSAAAKCTNAWRIFVDADEEISPELAAEIQATVATEEAKAEAEQCQAFVIPRRNFYLGRWIKYGGWKSDREIRLYKAPAADWTPGLHSCLGTEKVTRQLEHLVLHYPYADISGQLATIDKYSGIAAQDMLEEGKRPNYLKMCFNPPFRFFRDYILKQGFRDGLAGVVIAGCTAFYVFIKHAKLAELKNSPSDEKGN